MLTDKVYDTIIKYNMINSGDAILVGVSGGADSIFLLHSLIKIREKMSFELYAAHMNHGIRGDEAKRDETFVKEYCEYNHIPLFIKTVDIPKISKEYRLSEETAGRNERYKFFKEICKDINLSKIAVAHNMNDSVETIIHNMIRGASLNGLCGIKPVNENIIRPIIEVGRPEIETYLNDNNISYCTDSTNSSDMYTRNKIRNNIIKSMLDINPAFIQTVFTNSINLRNDYSFICEYTKSLKCISCDGEKVIVEKNIFDKQHLSIKSRIIMQAFDTLKGDCDGISTSHIEIISNASDSGRLYNMPGGVDVLVSFDKIVFMNEAKNNVSFEYNYRIGDKLEYLPGAFLKSSYCCKYDANDKNALYIDADSLKCDILKVRSKIDGDKFIPYGMTSSKKIKKYFTELKIPIYKRNEIPIILDDNQVVCIVPYRISELYKTHEKTKHIVKFEITKEK